MSIISLSKLDKDLAEQRISRDEYIEKCKHFFNRKREKYRDTYHKRKQRDLNEELKSEQEIYKLMTERNILLKEQSILVKEVRDYQYQLYITRNMGSSNKGLD